jgi:hypothetical protein
VLGKVGGRCEPEFPFLGNGVEAGGENRKVGSLIVAGARISLRCASALEIDPRAAITQALSEHVLALDEDRSPALPTQAEIGLAFALKPAAVCYPGNAA